MKVRVGQNLNFAKVKFSSNASTIVLKNQRPSGSAGQLSQLADVDMTGAANNGVLAYNANTQTFSVHTLDGGTF